MIRRISSKLSRERDHYVPANIACIQGEYWMDDEGNILPPGNTWNPIKEPAEWQN